MDFVWQQGGATEVSPKWAMTVRDNETSGQKPRLLLCYNGATSLIGSGEEPKSIGLFLQNNSFK